MDKLKELFSLEGLQIIVTGASQGLGLNMAVLLAKCGAKVYGLSRSGEIKEKQHEKLPDNLIFDRLDVTSEDDIADKFWKIGEDGGIDVLVNNAGITLRKPAHMLTSEEWREVHAVNVDGLFNCCRYAFPYLKKSNHTGRIINISSMASHLGFSEIAPYVSAKSAVVGLTRALAVEWRNKNILVNSVSPGWFPSPMNRQVVDKNRSEKIIGRIPLGRLGRPEELSSMICFFASPAATYITGQDFSVDGGALAFGY